MPYSRTSELPEAVRGALPPRAQRVFREAFNGAVKRGLSEERAFASAWGAVRNAGWHKPEGGGMWVKKADDGTVAAAINAGLAIVQDAVVAKQQPSSAEVHVDAPMGGKKKKPKGKPKGKPNGENDDDDEDDEHPMAMAFEIAKNADGSLAIDEDQNLVFGWLSVIEENGEVVVDLQGHVIDEATLEKAAYGMVINGCDAGEMHERIGIGLGLVECMMFTKAKQEVLGIDLGKVGLWVGFKVDDEAFAKVKSGELAAFSLGGLGIEEDIEEAA